MYLGFTLHLGLEGLWIGLTVALVYAAFLAIWICIRTDWPAEAVRVAARLEADQKPRDEETN
jgi:multidrug resistance protein, MATE family